MQGAFERAHHLEVDLLYAGKQKHSNYLVGRKLEGVHC
jgi:hypothetical protein